jgi:hypothetical protein
MQPQQSGYTGNRLLSTHLADVHGKTASPSVVEMSPTVATASANRFFERRTKVMTRACGSPHIPFSRPTGRQMGKRYNSDRVCPVFMCRRLNQKFGEVHSCHSPRKNTNFRLKNHEIYTHETGKTQ